MNKNKYMGISKVGEKGQIVIPKEVRDIFDIKPGNSLIVLADAKKGIALVKSEVIEDVTNNILGGMMIKINNLTKKYKRKVCSK